MDKENKTETVELIKRKLTGLIYASEEILIQDLKLDISKAYQWLSDELVIRLSGFVWSEELETKEIVAPKDWWEALKERWFPRWWLRRWPVIYRKQKIEAFALYPKFNVPREERVIKIRQYEPTDGWWLKDDDVKFEWEEVEFEGAERTLDLILIKKEMEWPTIEDEENND